MCIGIGRVGLKTQVTFPQLWVPLEPSAAGWLHEGFNKGSFKGILRPSLGQGRKVEDEGGITLGSREALAGGTKPPLTRNHQCKGILVQ